MKLINLRKKFLGTLVVVGLAMMLVGCAGTSDGDSDSDSSDGGCDCEKGDLECLEDCSQPVL
jgi:hypothetical protein